MIMQVYKRKPRDCARLWTFQQKLWHLWFLLCCFLRFITVLYQLWRDVRCNVLLRARCGRKKLNIKNRRPLNVIFNFLSILSFWLDVIVRVLFLFWGLVGVFHVKMSKRSINSQRISKCLKTSKCYTLRMGYNNLLNVERNWRRTDGFQERTNSAFTQSGIEL